MSLLSAATTLFKPPTVIASRSPSQDITADCVKAAKAAGDLSPAALLGVLHMAGNQHIATSPSGPIKAFMLERLTTLIQTVTNKGPYWTQELDYWLTLTKAPAAEAVFSAYLSIYTNYYFAGPEIPLAALFGTKDSLGAFETIVVPTHTGLLTASPMRKLVEGRSKLLFTEDVLSGVLTKVHAQPEVVFSSAVVLVRREFEKLRSAPMLAPSAAWLTLPKYTTERDVPLEVPAGTERAMACFKLPLLNMCLAHEDELPAIWSASSWEARVVFAHFHPQEAARLPDYAAVATARKQFDVSLPK